MSYLKNPYKDNFQELCACMPLFYLEVFEMREILKVQGRLLDGACDGFERIVDDNFIRSIDDAALLVWEDILGITYEGEPTLEQRKNVVIARLCRRGHIGEPEIREITRLYTDGEIYVGFAKGVITLEIDGEFPEEISLIKNLLKRIPAHLRLLMQVKVRREFRQTINFSFGGEIITNGYAPPPGEDRTSILPLPVGMGSYVETSGDSQPIGEDRETHTQVSVSYGGAVFRGFKPPPVGEDRETRAQVNIENGSVMRPELIPRPVGEDREAHTQIPLNNGGALVRGFNHPAIDRGGLDAVGLSAAPGDVSEDSQSGILSNTCKPTRGREDGAGGLFYQTRTKSKLIE